MKLKASFFFGTTRTAHTNTTNAHMTLTAPMVDVALSVSKKRKTGRDGSVENASTEVGFEGELPGMGLLEVIKDLGKQTLKEFLDSYAHLTDPNDHCRGECPSDSSDNDPPYGLI